MGEKITGSKKEEQHSNDAAETPTASTQARNVCQQGIDEKDLEMQTESNWVQVSELKIFDGRVRETETETDRHSPAQH